MAQELNFQAASDRLPPQNIDAEETILGGILLDPEAIGRVVDQLVPEGFYIRAHQDIYRAALALHSQGKPTDLMSITTWLYDHNQLERIGGQSKLAQLVDRTVSAVNIDALATLVMDKYLRRKLIQAGNEINQLGYETAIELETVLDQSEQKIFNLTQARPQQGLVPISEALIQTFNDIETLHQGIALPGIPCGFYDLDAMTEGFQRSDLIIVAARPSMGKCCAFNTEILLSDGSLATIEEIYHRAQAKLLTLKQDWRFDFTQPSAFVDDGIKPVFRLTTQLGRFVETTLTHPYLTLQGWQPLSDLKVGDKIAVPRKLAVFGTETLADAEVKLLGYFVSRSGLTEEPFSNPLLEAEFTQLVAHQQNSLANGLQEFDFWGQSVETRRIPAKVFQLKRSQVALFLNRLFTNARVIAQKSGQIHLGYGTVSEKLARQVQHLLLRFGILAAVKKDAVITNNRSSWQLEITHRASIKSFIEEISIFGQEDTLAQAKLILADTTNDEFIPLEGWQKLLAEGESEKSLAERFQTAANLQLRQSGLSREELFILATNLESLPLQNLATSDIYWDEIVAIEWIGEQQVYDLTISETHNFVANDLCVHNTSFALNVAHNIAAGQKLPIAVFSLEMSQEQLVQRLLAGEAGIESNRLRAGRVSQNEWEPLSNAIGTLSQLPMYIDDTANLTVMQMRSQARRLQAEQGGKLGLIMLDYLQLMEGGGDNRVQELSKITRSLKGLARELNVPIIALSQLSRSVEARTNKRPMLSDLRESGSIEQDADLVIMLYRDEYYHNDTPDRGIAEIIIAKHRNGPTGTVKLLFDPQYTRFRNLASPNRR